MVAGIVIPDAHHEIDALLLEKIALVVEIQPGAAVEAGAVAAALENAQQGQRLRHAAAEAVEALVPEGQRSEDRRQRCERAALRREEGFEVQALAGQLIEKA